MSPMIPHGGGWGAQSFGGSGWGGSPGAFQVVGVLAPAENVIRLIFNELPYYSEIFDEYDASDVVHFEVASVPSTGWDGNPSRDVSPVLVLVSDFPNALDVYLDRPMSPFPAQYVLSYENLANASLSSVLPPGSAEFFGVFKKLQPQHEDVTLPTSDIANPQTASAIQGSGLGSALPPNAALGVFNVDDSGDYAFDAGIQSVKKRIIRVGVSNPGAFAHLPMSYGVGLLDDCKRLQRADFRNRKATAYQAQILREPEVVSARVTAIQDPQSPELVHFLIAARTKIGTTLSFDHPVNIVSGISLAPITMGSP